MKNRTLLYTVLSLLLAATLWSCGPSYVGVRTGPPYGYYGPRPYYGGYGYYRPRPRVYVAPPRAYYRRPYYSYRSIAPRYHGGRRGYR